MFQSLASLSQLPKRFTNVFRNPTHVFIIGDEFIAQVFHFDVPGIDGAVDEWGVGAVAEWIAVLDLALMNQLAFIFEAANDGLVGVSLQNWPT